MNYKDIVRTRIKIIRELLKEQSADAVLITSAPNILYITGFQGLSPHEREAVAMITMRDVLLFIPAMYAEQAKTTPGVQSGGVEYIVDKERDGLLSLYANFVSENALVLFEDTTITVAEREDLGRTGAHRWKPERGMFAAMRMKKDSVEIELLRDVVTRTDIVFNELVRLLQREGYAGRTESDISDLLRVLGRRQGLTRFAFEPIVAAGMGSSQPHYRTGLSPLVSGMPLLMDFGFTLDGYHSDLTRTIFLGTAPEDFKTNYATVLECNRISIAACRADGIKAGELHSRAVRFFDRRNLSGRFIHGLGHGVGLEVHEEPFFRPSRSVQLEPGMVVTIEPGLYFPGEYGIRIEDYVLITDGAPEVLSSGSNNGLIEIR